MYYVIVFLFITLLCDRKFILRQINSKMCTFTTKKGKFCKHVQIMDSYEMQLKEFWLYLRNTVKLMTKRINSELGK